MFDQSLNYKLYDVIKQYSEMKPSLIFCSSRKGASQAAHQLIKDDQKGGRSLFIRDQLHKQKLLMLSNKIQDKSLAGLNV